MSDPRGYEAAPWITHERLDDEVMAIDLETGAYFALDDVAADAWTLITAGGPVSEVAVAMATRYDTDLETARVDLERFVADLEGERLVVRVETPATAGVADATTLPPLTEPRAYVAPTVSKYDDLEELLRLDPVHEVDEVGWPVPRRD